MADGVMPLNDAPFEAQQLAVWLTDGKPELGWRGDPRLSLHIGVLTAANSGFDRRHSGNYFRKGDVVAYRYEVYRHNEDGTDTRILERDASKWHEIIPALIGADPRTPGFVDVMDSVEADNAKVEKANSDAFHDSYGEMIDHLWSLTAERQNGKNTFRQMPGSNPEKQL